MTPETAKEYVDLIFLVGPILILGTLGWFLRPHITKWKKTWIIGFIIFFCLGIWLAPYFTGQLIVILLFSSLIALGVKPRQQRKKING